MHSSDFDPELLLSSDPEFRLLIELYRLRALGRDISEELELTHAVLL